MADWRLVADVGGTHVRFARALADGRLADWDERATAGHPEFADALGAYLEAVGGAGDCNGAAIAAAGPPSGDEIKLTNGVWTIRRSEVSRRLGGAPVRLFNDLEAAALAIPWLDAGDLIPVVTPGRTPSGEGARLAVNVGTGFGGAALVPVPGGWASLAAEPGHMTLGATSAEELALRTGARPPVRSVEDALSGAGLVSLYRFFAGTETDVRTSQQILARTGADSAAARATETFTVLLGRVAGDLVLAAGAWGGIYLFGGVVEGWQAVADADLFRAQFTAKGKMADRMATVPVHVVTNDAAPLIGLARHGTGAAVAT